MTHPTAIVLAAALIAGAVLADRLIPPATAQIETRQGFGAENAVAGERLWCCEEGPTRSVYRFCETDQRSAEPPRRS